jgi:hypothetical protein
MTTNNSSSLRAYSVKLTTSGGKSVTLPRNLLTLDQAEAIAGDLQTLARQSGFGEVRVDLSPVGLDDRDRVLEEARSFFAPAGQPKTLPAVQVAVKCISCQTVVPLNEALNSSQQAADLLTGDPIAGDSRCEGCSQHSIENCYECRTEWLISNNQAFNFVCESCRERRP